MGEAGGGVSSKTSQSLNDSGSAPQSNSRKLGAAKTESLVIDVASLLLLGDNEV